MSDNDPAPMMGTVVGDSAICKRCELLPATLRRIDGVWQHLDEQDECAPSS